jgi:tetratricopeptide (TPR) repeat protein
MVRAIFLGVWLCGVWLVAGPGPGLAQDDPIDAERSQRYCSRLEAIQETRTALRERSTQLMAQSPYLQQQLASAMQQAMITSGALANTPKVVAIPQLVQTYGGIVGECADDVERRPQLALWYTFQDNTLLREQLMYQLAGQRQIAQQQYGNYQTTLLAIEQLSRDADAIFFEFRHLADVMGRRSLLEHNAAQALVGQWLQQEPKHAGAGLIEAYALRAAGRFDEAIRLLDRLDDNYLALEAIRHTVAAQVSVIGGDDTAAQRHLDQATRVAMRFPVSEPYLVRGWLHLAAGKWNEARQQARRARELSPRNIEPAVLEALVLAHHKPKQIGDAIRALQRAQLQLSPEDWHYHHAAGLLYAMNGDWNAATRALDAALAQAPTHVRQALEDDQASIKNNQVPAIDWRARLVAQWKPAP